MGNEIPGFDNFSTFVMRIYCTADIVKQNKLPNLEL